MAARIVIKTLAEIEAQEQRRLANRRNDARRRRSKKRASRGPKALSMNPKAVWMRNWREKKRAEKKA